MNETKQAEPVKETKHTPGPLPEGWKLKDGILTDSDGVERYVLDGKGRIDRMKVSIILGNYSFVFHARAWIMTPLEAAAPELLSACKAMNEWRDLVRQNYPELIHPFNLVKAAIAKAEGRS